MDKQIAIDCEGKQKEINIYLAELGYEPIRSSFKMTDYIFYLEEAEEGINERQISFSSKGYFEEHEKERLILLSGKDVLAGKLSAYFI